MKKVLFVMLILLPMMASAYDVEVDGIYYNLIPKGNIAEVTYQDDSGYMVNGGYSGDVVIPESITCDGVSYDVTAITKQAFYFCSELKSVTICNSIKSIGELAFAGCENLTSIVIPNSVETLGDFVFANCDNIESVVISDMVTNISTGTFSNCKKLSSVTLSPSVTTIGAQAFYYCYKLENFDMPSNVISIGEKAFYDCSLTSIKIPNTVNNIGKMAFSCTFSSTLKKVIIDDIDSWCRINFANQSANPLSIAQHLYIGDKEITELVIPNTVTEIKKYAFYDFGGMESLTISNNAETIGECSFQGCIGLHNVQLPNSVSRIGKYAFAGCSNMESLTIGKSTNFIGQFAFSNCQNLKDVYCLAEILPSSSSDIFNESYIEYATLHVPTDLIDYFRDAVAWRDFGNIVALSGETPELKKCEVPTISYTNGKLIFTCDTEGAECVATISDTDIKTHYGNEIPLTATYTVSVYAIATGYENSDVTTATLCWIDADLKTEGIENGIAQVRANTVLIQSHDGILSIAGINDGTDIAVYSASGLMVGSAKAHGATSTVTTTLRSGDIAIVHIGDKSVKVVMQ